MDCCELDGCFGHAFSEIIPVCKGLSSDQKYRVTLNDGRYCLLRISSADQLERKRSEYTLLQTAFENGIRVPVPYAFDTMDDGVVYQLIEWLDGCDLETRLSFCDTAENYILGRKAAILLKQIHAIPAPDTSVSWKERFYQKILVRLKEARHICSRVDFSAIKQYLLENIDILNKCEQCFNHGDFNPGNLILLENAELAAIDFNSYNSGYGEPVFETTGILLDEKINADFRRGFEENYFDAWTNTDYKTLLNYYRIYDFLARLCETQDDCEKTQLLKQIEEFIF